VTVTSTGTPVPSSSRHVHPELFREALGAVATPVTVVTTTTGDDRPVGTTVSAFSSLSLDPPMIIVCLDRGSALLEELRASRRMGVNVLAADQGDTARGFARKGVDKFAGVEWSMDDGLPRIQGSAAWLACDIDAFVDGGDHLIATAHVTHADVVERPPMVYFRRVFGTHHTPSSPRHVTRLEGETR